MDGRDTLAYFLSSIILDAKSKKNVEDNQEFFLCLYPKILSDINKTRLICNSSKMMANFSCLRVVSGLAFVGLRWPLLAFVGLHWPLVAFIGLCWP